MIIGSLLLTGACQRPPEVRHHAPEAYPQRLSQWGVLRRDGDRLTLGRDVHPYDVNTPLFSDYALKLRTYHLPDGTAMSYRERDSFDFPQGSIISKTFFYPLEAGVAQAPDGWHGQVADLDLAHYRLVETRLLIRRGDGWDALPYVWRDDDAYLSLTGAVVPMTLAMTDERLEFPYVVPGRSECAGCHATDHGQGTLELIGVKARHLNRSYAGGVGENQLVQWSRRSDLSNLPAMESVPRNAVWDDPRATLAQRARAYLDGNCGHCHSPTGAADTSGLMLDAHTTGYRQLGFCKAPIAAGRGTGGRPFSIVPGQPDQSILVYRMETDDPATRMPEIGRAVSHREGVALIRRWVAELEGQCI